MQVSAKHSVQIWSLKGRALLWKFIVKYILEVLQVLGEMNKFFLDLGEELSPWSRMWELALMKEAHLKHPVSSPIISAVESLSCFPFSSLEIRFKRYSIKYEGSVITNDGQRKHNENSLLFRSALVFFSLLWTRNHSQGTSLIHFPRKVLYSIKIVAK